MSDPTLPSPGHDLDVASFWRRAAAYTLDIVPIAFGMGAVFWFFFGLDEAWRDRGAGIGARLQFYSLRNLVRELSLATWLIYCTYADATRSQGTLGKRLMGLKVVRVDGQPLTRSDSAKRNVAKIASGLPLAIGFLWALFAKSRLTWHDRMSQTRVVRRSANPLQAL